MATSQKATWVDIQSKLMKMGYGENIVIGEPRTAMQSGTVAIMPIGGEVDETVLSGPREIHNVLLRMYVNWMDDPQENTEYLLDQFRANIMADIFGDFDLGGTVAYALPTEFAWDYDEINVENTLYRTVTLLVAYRVDGNATFAK